MQRRNRGVIMEDLFDKNSEPKEFDPHKEWQGMPEFVMEKQKPYKELKIRFASKDDYEKFAFLIEQNLTEKTKSIWYPKLNRSLKSGLEYINED
jgi:hypothetical protein